MKSCLPASKTFLCCICMLMISCGTAPPLDKVRVTGASTVYPIVQMAGETLREQGLLLVEAQAGGSTRGFEDNIAGRNDLGAMARELTQAEAREVNKYPIAYDGVGVVVHADNPLTGISKEQLRAIYRKETTHWHDLTGENKAIVAVNKAEGHATLETFLAYTGLTREEMQVDVVAGDNAQVIRAVANAPNAIGYVSMGEVIHAAEIGMPVRLIPVDGIAPTLEAVADGTFPMFRTLYLVCKNEPGPAGRQLLDFLDSEQGRAIIQRGKYVPLP